MGTEVMVGQKRGEEEQGEGMAIQMIAAGSGAWTQRCLGACAMGLGS